MNSKSPIPDEFKNIFSAIWHFAYVPLTIRYRGTIEWEYKSIFFFTFCYAHFFCPSSSLNHPTPGSIAAYFYPFRLNCDFSYCFYNHLSFLRGVSVGNEESSSVKKDTSLHPVSCLLSQTFHLLGHEIRQSAQLTDFLTKVGNHRFIAKFSKNFFRSLPVFLQFSLSIFTQV